MPASPLCVQGQTLRAADLAIPLPVPGCNFSPKFTPIIPKNEIVVTPVPEGMPATGKDGLPIQYVDLPQARTSTTAARAVGTAVA